MSYSTGNSGIGKDVEFVKAALKSFQNIMPEIDSDGPLQYDAAINKKIAIQKMPNSKVAGNANVLIFPDLNTGNNVYKAVQQTGNILAVGPILQGLNKPVNDLSRGTTVNDIINTILITALL
jgi:phosphate acetyltransferase